MFTIPKWLRVHFQFDRRLLGDLCGAAARTVITVYRAASGRPDAVPGTVGAIQIPLCGTNSSMRTRASNEADPLGCPR